MQELIMWSAKPRQWNSRISSMRFLPDTKYLIAGEWSVEDDM